jgi:hypothetical protein
MRRVSLAPFCSCERSPQTTSPATLTMSANGNLVWPHDFGSPYLDAMMTDYDVPQLPITLVFPPCCCALSVRQTLQIRLFIRLSRAELPSLL